MLESRSVFFLRNPPDTALWWLVGVLAYCVLWVSPVFSATYDCLDESGARVLTDNPVQLFNCTQLPSQSSTLTNQTPSTVPTLQATTKSIPNQAPPDTQISIGLSSSLDGENQDGPFNEDITIPLTKSGGSFIVPVVLNQERSAQLIVDTGASMTVLSNQVAIDLGILGTTDNELLTVNTAGGSVQVNMNYLSSISVGTAQATNVAVALHDLPDIPEHIEGLLGMSFLKHFLVTLDAEHAQLILRPKQKP
ncbi:retropepsin-like aspartic protease [Nitrospira sp. MA-1]|nr:retropepsin-like aspartic protease [Nitrospira sp. MA-1]